MVRSRSISRKDSAPGAPGKESNWLPALLMARFISSCALLAQDRSAPPSCRRAKAHNATTCAWCRCGEPNSGQPWIAQVPMNKEIPVRAASPEKVCLPWPCGLASSPVASPPRLPLSPNAATISPPCQSPTGRDLPRPGARRPSQPATSSSPRAGQAAERAARPGGPRPGRGNIPMRSSPWVASIRAFPRRSHFRLRPAGDIFNARIAGNIADPDLVGSMEFTCGFRSTKLTILVMGHHQLRRVIKGACDNVEVGNLTGLLPKD